MLADRQPVEQARHLGLDADPAAGDEVGVITGDVLPAEHDAAGGRLELAGQHLEQRALAGAVGPDQAAQLTLGEREVHATYRLHSPEPDREIDGLQQRGAHGPGSSLRERAGPGNRAPRATSEGTRPRGTRSTNARKMAPKIRLVLAICCVPSVVARYCMIRQPMIGPSSVPSPPTMTQMMICEVMPRLNTVGLTNAPQLAKRLPASPAMPPPTVKISSLCRRTS